MVATARKPTSPKATKRKAVREDGHDAIVRRLLASRPGQMHEVEAGAPSPEELGELARRFTSDALPELEGFAGPALAWKIDATHLGEWKDGSDDLLASVLTANAAPKVLVTCNEDFLALLMTALFGTASSRRGDATASELSVFAQLVVRLRDVLFSKLDHAPPGEMEVVLSRCGPLPGTPVAVEVSIRDDRKGAATDEVVHGRLRVALSRSLARTLLPKTTATGPGPSRMSGLPLAAEVQLRGAVLSLSELSNIKIGSILPVGGKGCALMSIDGHEVATGAIGVAAGRRTFSLNDEGEPRIG